MLLKPGDKVSFLNEKRDGIVKKVLNNKMVLVEIEDGFTIPVLEHDLVKVQTMEEHLANKRAVDSQKNTPVKQEEVESVRFPERRELNRFASDKEKTKSGMYIAFVPEQRSNTQSSSLGVYLMNHNPYDVLFTYALKEQSQFICKDFDRIDEESAYLLDVIDKTDIEKWKDLRFQCLFYKQDAPVNRPPLVCDTHFKPVQFYKEGQYAFNSLLNETCLLLSVTDKTQPDEWGKDEWENKKVEKPSGLKIIGHINNLNKTEPFPEKHILEKGVAEVDLHIEELTDHYSGKENIELLNIQLDYFSKMLESAITHKFKRIIFIHGVGNGKLKQEITQVLQANHPELTYEDASFLRYGKGATVVYLTEIN